MITERLGVVAGIFAARLTDAVRGGPQVGTRAAQVLVEVVGHLIEDFFQLGGGGTQKNNVAGRAVHVGDTAAAEIPEITELS